jgi:hypothetical protein
MATEEKEVIGSRQLVSRPSSRHMTAWDQSLVQLQAAFMEFTEDKKSVKCLACSKSSTFGKAMVIKSAIQTLLYAGEGGVLELCLA